MINDNESEWTSIHVFYQHDLNILLLNLIDPILNEWYQKEVITNHFFIRYWEGGQHIRLRIKSLKKLNNDEIVKNFRFTYEHNFLGSKYYDLEFKIVFIDYVQELVRYGGFNSIGLAERAFEDSSIAVMAILKQYEQQWDYSMAISIAMQAHMLFIKVTGLSLENAVSFLEFLVSTHIKESVKDTRMQNIQQEIDRNKDFFEKSYLIQKESIDFLCREIWEHNEQESNNWRRKWSKSIERMIENFNYLESKKLLEEPEWLGDFAFQMVSKNTLKKWLILSSYFHMTNNRIGIHLRDESYIYYALRNGMSVLTKEESRKK